MCLIPLLLRKSANSAEINWGPLSVVMVSGKPHRANQTSNISEMTLVVTVPAVPTSGHLE